MLIENFSFNLNPGDKAAIIGEEGNGKSTLLQLMHDEKYVLDYCEYTGQIIRKGRTAYLPQFFSESNSTLEEYFSDTTVFQNPQILNQLRLPFEITTSSQLVDTLSGGEKIKIQLAKILLQEPDIFLLDEPSNDIDIAALEWLEKFIGSLAQPIIFISHDETLIEATANTIIHIEQLMRKTKCKITTHHMGYAEYISARNLAHRKQTQIAQKQRSDHKAPMEKWQQVYNKVNHEQRVVSRQDPGTARLLKKKMKAVKSTGKRLEKKSKDFLDIPEMEEAILTKFDPKIIVPSGKVILSLALPELRVNEQNGKKLSENINLNIHGAQRIGIIGANGVGKSTLLKKIWDELRCREDVVAGYMPQDYTEVLDYNKSVIDYVTEDSHKDTITKARTFLGAMKFTSDEMLSKISCLSGGQKAKLLFLSFVLKNANVLILDEPTRNFSPLSAPEIRKTLADFGGAIISVSHDRKYLKEVCDSVFEMNVNGLVLL